MKKFYILDGSGFLFRAYHAFPYMTNSDWFNVNVAYGFMRMMVKLFLDKPDYLVIARDAPSKTLRHEMDETYKANRPEADPDLKRQIPYTQEIVAQLHIPSIQIPWFEADDIIATLARTYKQQENMQVIVVSSDKDLKQLIDDNVIVKDAMKNIDTTKKSFIQEYGFEPTYMLDYLTLIGDSSDNIPWVPGIGPKRAQTLIQKYNTIEQMYQHLDEMSQDLSSKLQECRQIADHAKSLVTLYDIPALQEQPVENYLLDCRASVYEKILIKDHQFHSMEKALKELKNKRELPQQESLFG